LLSPFYQVKYESFCVSWMNAETQTKADVQPTQTDAPSPSPTQTDAPSPSPGQGISTNILIGQYRISFCPIKIKTVADLESEQVCCFHPLIRNKYEQYCDSLIKAPPKALLEYENLQSKLISCATEVKGLLDIIDHPECCDHEGTLIEYGGCCLEMSKGNEDGCNDYEKPFVADKFTFSIPHLTELCLKRAKVFSIVKLKANPICCLHPVTQRIIPEAKEYCLTEHGLGKRKKRVARTCLSINYCPRKMLSNNNWADKDKFQECCLHPYRKTVMLPRNHANLKDYECCKIGHPRVKVNNAQQGCT